ncbi:site-specific integrase [Gramella jeungdoensis]|uniref:Site-specific integrase n=1 Tax=Gramella jeungdoensis TaxID=708091 RepID=A0ABT0Z1T4_9FLAO|nr:site-specific integrase [Gramella jeungdoensis]MCM8569690.1 site-specific integrase [Gramella jeungdoensis]
MITTKIILRKRKLSNGQYPVLLRIIKDKKVKYIRLELNAKEEEFEDQEFKKNHPNYRKRNNILAGYKLRINNIIDDFISSGKEYSLDDVVSEFKGKTLRTNNVWDHFNEKERILIRSGRIGSADAFKQTKQVLSKFKQGDLTWGDITPSFLEQFELFMRERGNSDGGIAFRFRQLRALYNDAINKKIISSENYPFRSYRISKLKPTPDKRALSISELRSFRNVDLTEHPNLVDAHNYFMFSFYLRGINFHDLMILKWSQIMDNKIIYKRSKTKGRFVVELLPPALKILNSYKDSKPDTEYIFPILLKNNLNPQQIANRKHKALRSYNKKLQEIGELANINKRITSYVVRHTYATVMKYKGVSTDIICESLGHSNLNVTKAYLKEFDNEVINNEHRKLLDL